MAYEEFWEALKGYEKAYEGYRTAVAAGEQDPAMADLMRTFAATSIEELAVHSTGIWYGLFQHSPERSELEAREFIGGAGFLVDRPEILPDDEMLKGLRLLNLPDADYQPDESETGSAQYALRSAIHVKGTLLYATWLLSGYGDDIQPTLNELNSLLARFTGSDLYATVLRIHSLSHQIAAVLASHSGDYVEALSQTAACMFIVCSDALDRFVEADHRSEEESPEELPDFLSTEAILHPMQLTLPWLSGIGVQAENFMATIEHLSASRNIDWTEVTNSCQILSRCYLRPGDYMVEHPIDNVGETQHVFWATKMGWAQSQTTPDRIRSLIQSSHDVSAADRLQTYFFPDDLWQMLPERAHEALVTADRMMVSATSGRRAGILNEVRIATEEVLRQYLWLPLSEYTKKQPSLYRGMTEILAKPQAERRSPSIRDYVELLRDDETRRYLTRERGLSDRDVEFLIKEKRTTQFLETLRRTRNRAEHEPSSALGSTEIHDLYAEALGIGRRGVLPSLLRLLASGSRGGG